MAEGVAGYGNHLQLQAEQVQAIAVAEGTVAAGDVLVCGAPDAALGGRLEGVDAANMVGVVMGHQNVAEAVFRVSTEPGDYRPGVARVNRGNLLALLVDQ